MVVLWLLKSTFPGFWCINKPDQHQTSAEKSLRERIHGDPELTRPQTSTGWATTNVSDNYLSIPNLSQISLCYSLWDAWKESLILVSNIIWILSWKFNTVWSSRSEVTCWLVNLHNSEIWPGQVSEMIRETTEESLQQIENYSSLSPNETVSSHSLMPQIPT